MLNTKSSYVTEFESIIELYRFNGFYSMNAYPSRMKLLTSFLNRLFIFISFGLLLNLSTNMLLITTALWNPKLLLIITEGWADTSREC